MHTIVSTHSHIDKNGEVMMRRIWSKANKEFRLRKVYSEKTFNFRKTIMDRILMKAKAPTKQLPGVSASDYSIAIFHIYNYDNHRYMYQHYSTSVK